MADSKASRLAYIDWMRGLACVLMFQTHCYDSWLSPAARRSSFFTWSQVLGTLPAPLFLFLSGLSVSLVIGKLESAGAAPNKVAATVMRRVPPDDVLAHVAPIATEGHLYDKVVNGISYVEQADLIGLSPAAVRKRANREAHRLARRHSRTAS